MSEEQEKPEGRRRPAPRADRLLQLAGSHYELRRTREFPYLLRGERRYLFEGQDRRTVAAQLRDLWRREHPDDGRPSRDDIAEVLDDLRLHAELVEPDPPTAAEQASELLAEHGIDEDDGAEPYFVKDGCTWWRKPAQGGGVAPVMLATFAAVIAEELTLDDGAERTLTWLVRVAARDGRAGEVRITPDHLGRPQQWAAKAAGVSALVMPGLAIADHLRVAVQSGSDPQRRTVYTHTGWREIGGRHVYLTASGALGADGLDESVTVDLGTLGGYAVPGVRDVRTLREAVRASLDLMLVAPGTVTVPLLGAVYRAPLPLPPDCAVWVYGRSGTYKTELTALGQQHYGPSMNAKNLPGNWTSTPNALEAQAFTLNSALFVVDDYSPDASRADAQKRTAAADRLVRGSANRSGRGRMRPDGTMRPARPPRAQVLTSAEDVPPGVESMRARAFIAEVTPGCVDLARLTAAQAAAVDGLLASATSGYIQWLAGRWDADSSLAQGLAAVRDQYRDQARSAGHPRCAVNIASLALGWHEFLACAGTLGAITAAERAELWKRVWAALGEVGSEQERYRRDADPVLVYLRALGALVDSRRAYLASLDGRTPVNAARWGWEHIGNDEHGHDLYHRPNGADLIGWTDGENVYLQPDTAYKAAKLHAEASGHALTVSKRMLHKQMDERGLLASKSPGHGFTARVRAAGGQPTVLHLTVRGFGCEDPQ